MHRVVRIVEPARCPRCQGRMTRFTDGRGRGWTRCMNCGQQISREASLETAHKQIDRLNEKISQKTPGYYVRCNDSGKLEYELVGPDGHVHYRRDRLAAIAAVALGRR